MTVHNRALALIQHPLLVEPKQGILARTGRPEIPDDTVSRELLQRFALTSSTYAKRVVPESDGALNDYLSLEKARLDALVDTPPALPSTRWYSGVWQDDSVNAGLIGGLLFGFFGGFAGMRIIVDENIFGTLGGLGSSVIGGMLAGLIGGFGGGFIGRFGDADEDIGKKFGRWGGGLGGAAFSMGCTFAASYGQAMQSWGVGLGGAALAMSAGLALAGGIPAMSVIKNNLAKIEKEKRNHQKALEDRVANQSKLARIETLRTHALDVNTIANQLAVDLQVQREFLDTTLRNEFTRMKVEAEADKGRAVATEANLGTRLRERRAEYEQDKNSVPYDLILDLDLSVQSQQRLRQKVEMEIAGYEEILKLLDAEIKIIDTQLANESRANGIARDYELIGQSAKARETMEQAQRERMEFLQNIAVVSSQISDQAILWHQTRLEMSRDVEVAEGRSKML